MPQTKIQFTRMEGMSLLCVAFIFQAFNEVITISVREAGNAAWISQILSVLLVMGVLMLYLLLLRRFEGMSLLEIVDQIFGKAVAKIVIVFLLGYILFLVSVTLHEIVMLLRSFAYSEVSPLLLCCAIMAVACIVCRHPVKGLAMTASLFLPLFLFLIVLVICVCAPQFRLHYLTPLLGYGPKQIGIQSFYLVSNYENILILALFLPSFGSTRQFGKSTFTAVVIAGLCFLGVSLSYSLMFPYTAIFQNSSAMLNMTQSVYINRFLQRFESAFVAGVTSSVILVICIKLMAAKQAYCHLFSIRSENANAVLYPMAVAVVLLTEFLADFNAHENSYRSFARRYSSFIVVGFVLLLLLVAALRKKGARRPLRFASLLLVPCLLFTTLLTGCDGYHEPDEEIYPVIMGYDKGESEKYKITFRLMLGKEAEGTPDVNDTFSRDENGDPPPEIFIVEAPSALVALDYMSSLVPKRFSLMHINLMIISEELAREDLDSIVSPIIRNKETKNTMAFLITRGSAQETIMAPSGKLDSSLPMFIESILQGKNGITNYDTVTVKDVYNMLDEGYGDAIAMYAGYEGLEEETAGKGEEDPVGILVKGGGSGPESQTEEENSSPQEEHRESSGGGESSTGFPANEESTTGLTAESLDKELGLLGGEEEEEEGGTGQGRSGEEEGAMENIGPAGVDETIPESMRPTASRIKNKLSQSMNQGFIPGQIPVKSSAKMEIAGMAVIKNKKMVGYINSRENAVHMMLKGNFYNGYYDVSDPNDPQASIICRMHSRQPTRANVRIDSDGVAHIDLQVYLKGRLAVAQNTGVRYTEPEPRRELEEYITGILEREAGALIDKLQHEFHADTLQLGSRIAGEFLTIPQYEAYDWNNNYQKAQISVQVHFKL